jgi:hypothetical protein
LRSRSPTSHGQKSSPTGDATRGPREGTRDWP